MQVRSRAGPKHVLMSGFDLFTVLVFLKAGRADLQLLVNW